MTRPRRSFHGQKAYLVKESIQERAYKWLQSVADGSKEANYCLGRIETKAKNAAKKGPARAKRLADRAKRNAILKASGQAPKAKTRKSLLRDADMWFSRFIRLRDSETTFSGRAYAICVTCGNWNFVFEMDCGHWRRRENWATRFNEDNCNIQCKNCNNNLGGNELKHEEYIRKTKGDAVADHLIKITTPKYQRRKSNEELEAIANKYSSIVTEMGGWPQ